MAVGSVDGKAAILSVAGKDAEIVDITVDAPAYTGDVFIAAPTPVTTPHAIKHAFSSGISCGILIAALL